MKRRTLLKAAAAFPVTLLSGCAVYDDGLYGGYYETGVIYQPVPHPPPPRPAPPPHFAGPGPRPGFRPAPPPPGPHRPVDPRMMHRSGGPPPIGPGRPGPGFRNPPGRPGGPGMGPRPGSGPRPGQRPGRHRKALMVPVNRRLAFPARG